jgi:TldD protein
MEQEYAELMAFLKGQKFQEWELVFRNIDLTRYILGQKSGVTNSFGHTSIRIRFRHNVLPRAVELGEGLSQTKVRFNQKGLIQRIKNILRNNQEKTPGEFVKTTVVLASGNGGVLLHEILGHSLEADYVYRKSSPFSKEHLGRRILPPQVTVTTRDSTDPFFGSYPTDDEGMEPPGPVIIENGILKYLISDYFHSRLLGFDSCGFCRLDSFENIPRPRMFGLYLQPGPHSPADILASVDQGIYAREFGRGSVDFNRRLFFLNINEAFAIRKGKLGEPLGALTVSGDIEEVLNSIEMVGNDFRYDSGINYCRKYGQSMNVRLGQPTLRIGNVLAGGFKNA